MVLLKPIYYSLPVALLCWPLLKASAQRKYLHCPRLFTIAHNCLPIAGCRLAHRAALHLPGEARVGAVLLQDRAEGGQRAGAQEPTSLHRHEPHRPQSGARYSCGE